MNKSHLNAKNTILGYAVLMQAIFGALWATSVDLSAHKTLPKQCLCFRNSSVTEDMSHGLLWTKCLNNIWALLEPTGKASLFILSAKKHKTLPRPVKSTWKANTQYSHKSWRDWKPPSTWAWESTTLTRKLGSSNTSTSKQLTMVVSSETAFQKCALSCDTKYRPNLKSSAFCHF